MAGINLMGYLSNEPDRLACALHELRNTLQAPPGAQGFGLAHWTDDRLLLNLRPSPVADGTPLEDVVGNIKTRTFIASLHNEGDGGPYKFRSWAFAMRGSAGRDSARPAMVQHLPDFLQRNISGETLGEAAFHRFLASLHAVNQVDDPAVDPKAVAEALRSTMDLMVYHSMGAARPAMVVSNGRFLAAVHVGGGLACMLREGILACQRCQLDKHALDPFPVRESHRRFKGVMVAGGLPTVPPGFMEVPVGKALLVTRKLEIQYL